MKKNKKATLLIMLILISFSSIKAQVSVAPKIGLSYSSLNGDYLNAKVMPGAFFGGMLNYRISRVYSFQTGLLLSGKGTTLQYTEDDNDEILISYLEVPLNSTINILAGSGYFQLFAGPYLGFAVNARYKYLEDDNDLTEKMKIGTSDTDEIKPTDIGLTLGVGYIYEGLEVQAGYSRSLSSISSMPGGKLLNNVITISLAYYFGYSTSDNKYRRRNRRT